MSAHEEQAARQAPVDISPAELETFEALEASERLVLGRPFRDLHGFRCCLVNRMFGMGCYSRPGYPDSWVCDNFSNEEWQKIHADLAASTIRGDSAETYIFLGVIERTIANFIHLASVSNIPYTIATRVEQVTCLSIIYTAGLNTNNR